MLRNFQIQHALCGVIAALALGQAALADDERAPRIPLLPQYQQECAACHLAYPPGMLPAVSWQRLMSKLSRHYGTDASLDPATQDKLSAWLNANAGTAQRARGGPPEDRITRSVWFIGEHDEVPARIWKLPAVKSAANCTACHTQAEQGDFSEQNVHIPG